MTVGELKNIIKNVPDNAVITIMSGSSDRLMKDDYDVENVIQYEDLVKGEVVLCFF